VTASKDSGYLIPAEHLDRAIVEIRGKRVILSHDLATAYGVSAKRLNEQVKRNIERFPDDFMFQLTPDEKAEVVANCDHLTLLKFSPSLPCAFTEHGVDPKPKAVGCKLSAVAAHDRPARQHRIP
jgi:hypothetical protein